MVDARAASFASVQPKAFRTSARSTKPVFFSGSYLTRAAAGPAEAGAGEVKAVDTSTAAVASGRERRRESMSDSRMGWASTATNDLLGPGGALRRSMITSGEGPQTLSPLS